MTILLILTVWALSIIILAPIIGKMLKREDEEEW